MKAFRCISFFSYAISQTNRDILQFLRVNLLVFSVVFFFSYMSAIAALRITYSRNLQEVIVLLFSFPFITYAAAGAVYYYTTFAKGVTVRLNLLYRAYRWFTYYLVYAVFLILVYLLYWKRLPQVCEYPDWNSLPVAFGALFSFYVVLRLFFLPLIFVDMRLSLEESVIESLRLSRGTMPCIILFLCIALCLLVTGILCVGAGVLYAAAVITIAYIKFYLVVRDEHYQD